MEIINHNTKKLIMKTPTHIEKSRKYCTNFFIVHSFEVFQAIKF